MAADSGLDRGQKGGLWGESKTGIAGEEFQTQLRELYSVSFISIKRRVWQESAGHTHQQAWLTCESAFQKIKNK